MQRSIDNTSFTQIFTPREIQVASVTLLLLVVAVLSLTVVDVRGSDQYWYLADTETLIHGKSPETNTRFPGMVLRQNNGNPQTFFLHNGPLLHFNALIGKFLGAFQAWKLSNILMLISTAFMTGLVAAYIAGKKAGYLAFIFYIVSPVVIWQASNLLIEPALAFVISALLLLHVRGNYKNSGSIALYVLVFLGVLLHPLFAALGVVYMLYFIVIEKQYSIAAVLTVVLALASLYKKTWFPSSFQPDIMTIITSAIPKTTNMLWHLTDVDSSLTPNLLWLKFTDAFRQQFANATLAPLYVVNNLGIGAYLYLLFRSKKSIELKRFLWLGFFVMGLYAAIVVLMQNQPRYQMIIVPIAISSLVIVLHQISWNLVKKRMLLTAITGLLAVDAVLITKLHADAVSQRVERQVLQAYFSEFSENTKVALMVSSIADYLRIAYVLKPRPVLMIHTKILEEEKQHKTLELFKPHIVISEEEVQLRLETKRTLPPIARPETSKTMHVYQLEMGK